MEFSAYLSDALAHEQATQSTDWEPTQHDPLKNTSIFVKQLVRTGLIPTFVFLGAAECIPFGGIAPNLNTAKAVAEVTFCNPIYLCNTTYMTEIQTLLAQRGFSPGDIDGVYGPATQAAILQFQAKHGGLAVDGIPGTQTLIALRGDAATNVAASPTPEAVPQNPNPSPDASKTKETNKPSITPELDREAISALQLLLKMRGFYDRPIDGVKGSAVTEAILKAQRAYGLPVNGLVDSALLASLQVGTKTTTAPPQQLPSTPASPEEVVSLQKQLQQKGFYEGSMHGKLDVQTRAAIMDAQAAYGFVVNGEFTQSFLTFLTNLSP
ncbi:peptidoglycan-binding domain-containing protein [Tumidithrix elongata RA019]|uniref:Peptidoglycan-binding domain-containing protein n=1 Tax=Tumidithrix elongata BACA0141 TaxID=2716417 RepID=A0AAW9PVG7_9CYAN|nr:peptidoglycan-binding domain-containing protein [Tumidithrix elongata RA019]